MQVSPVRRSKLWRTSLDVPRRHFGPRLTAVLSYMSGVLGMSRRNVVEFARSVWGMNISLGTVSALEGDVAKALAGAHEGVHEDIQKSQAPRELLVHGPQPRSAQSHPPQLPSFQSLWHRVTTNNPPSPPEVPK